MVRGEISPEAVARFDGASLDEDAALTAYDEAAAAVADGFARRADKASDAAAEVLTASAGLARDKGLRSAVRKHLRSGEDLLTSVAAAVEQFTAVFTQMGGLMAERVTDLRDIERRVVAHLVGEPEPGVQLPDEPAVLLAEDLAPSDTATLDPRVVLALVTERGGPTSHTAIISRQLGIPCVVGTHGAMEIEAGTMLLVDGTAGTIDTAPDPTRPPGWSRPTGRSGRRWPPGAARAETADGTRIKILANVADGESARGRAGARSRASGCSAPSSASSTAPTSRPPRSRPHLRRGARRRSPALRRGPHARCGLRQAGGLRDPRGRGEPRARRTRPAPVVRQPRPADPPARRHRGRPRATGTETWVMAPMVATVAEATDFARRCASAGSSPA